MFEPLPEFPEHLLSMACMEQKLTFIERRAMNDNMKPHELVRQLIETINSYEPKGDCTWPMRTVRDFMLDYMRALGMRYSAMRGDEKVQLCRVCLWEACKRHDHDIKDDEQRRATYELVVALCQETEFGEPSFLSATLFFLPENLSKAAPNLGYEYCKAYSWLQQNGSIEGKFEMKTILK